MQRYLPAMMWISRASLVFLFVFFVDYFLPWREATDQITGIYVGSRNNQLYYDIETLTGKQVRLGGSWRPEDFADGQIRLWTTPVFNSVTRAGSLTVPGTENVAHMYTTHVFFPLLLLLISILAIVYQHKVEFCFNLNLVGLILFIINLILI